MNRFFVVAMEHHFMPSPNGLLALLHRANQVATERFAQAIGESTLTARQVQVLAAIDANEGTSQTDIVAVTGIDRSTLADIVRRLSKRKLIERKRTKEDARAYAVRLTEAGRRELARAKPTWASVEKSLQATLTSKQQAELYALLGRIVASSASLGEEKQRK